MNDPADDSPAPVPSLPCATIVYRLLLKRDWIDPDTGAPQPAAFYRRTRPDGQPAEEGLSVFIAEKCSVDEAKSSPIWYDYWRGFRIGFAVVGKAGGEFCHDKSSQYRETVSRSNNELYASLTFALRGSFADS